MKKVHRIDSAVHCGVDQSLSVMVDLEAEYRLARAALTDAGIEMTDSMDALYRDWRRWRDQARSLPRIDLGRVARLDQWWARHLAQFRSLIDPSHVAARAERTRKDQCAARKTISGETVIF
jgi:hypothetical protein